jgi:23S rRNA (uracil1939-C5)-methyltransferase
VPDHTIDVDIEFLDASGDGIASDPRLRSGRPERSRTGAGRLTFAVPFTIPGERVRIRPAARSSSQPIPASLLEVLRASPHRVAPPCPHFGPLAAPLGIPCGGCAWQHIAYAEQLRLKTALVDRLLKGALRRVPSARPTLPGATLDYPWGYRQKVHFVFGNVPSAGKRPGRLLMGHYARGTRRVIPVRECPVHDERGNDVAFGFFKTFARAGITAPDHGVLRSLAVRVAVNTPEIAATLVVTDDGDRRLRAATRRAMQDRGAPTALHLNIHPRGDAFIFGRDTRCLSGPERLRESVAGVSFLISPTAFFQTNVPAAERLVEVVLDAVPSEATVLDLYAGAGLFALPLARRGARVTAIEENRAAVADGEASARLNRIPEDRCRFIARRVEAALASARPAEAVVLDPPREGCSGDVIGTVFGRLRPDTVVYVSCNPEALARDLSLAAPHGYAIESIQPVDMFPHTAHVETVVVLRAPARR